MSGFGINIEASIWQKVDNLIFKAVEKVIDLFIHDAKDGNVI